MIRTLSKVLSNSYRCLYTKRFLNCNTKEFNFDGSEEILENYLEKVMIISINLPEYKNKLNQRAVNMLCDSLKKFSEEDFSVAVMHGCGGNFCTGIEDDENTIIKSEEVIEIMHNLEKPIIGSLNGFIKNFGFQLAVMCDLTVLDETSLISFSEANIKSKTPDVVYQRLVSKVGISKAAEIVLMNIAWSPESAKDCGLTNRIVKCGSALSQAVTWAQSISMIPIETTIKKKSKIFSQLKL